MKFTVIWRPKSESKLAELWVGSRERSAITAAANAIDRQLKYDPVRSGWQRPDGSRLLIAKPLAVVYEVHTEDRYVFILDVELAA